MKKLLSSTILGLALATTLFVGIANANSTTTETTMDENTPTSCQYKHTEMQDLGHHVSSSDEKMRTKLKRTITNLEDGVVVTLTSDNADAVTMLQDNPHEHFYDDDDTVTKTIENLDNSEDPDKVEEIQNAVANDHKGKGGPCDR